ncbi:hypothetical protein COU58_00835 [Candidatus Pacearchaeota archaeon CG10_big_fil_rev_8_21_14_0_10_32_42]|nr:MAG: hypothetical protein COU58_00835 [Candidatus Pacearchaeota archaeon CG10_big_fil_rev_8_21_14_0_10_32_42]
MENKENYSPKEIAEYTKIIWNLRNEWYKLGNSDKSFGVFKNHAIELHRIIREYHTKIPENIRNEIGLNTSKIEKICEKIIFSGINQIVTNDFSI